jgi:hypothetical protein
MNEFIVEEATLEWFEQLGYTTLQASEIAPTLPTQNGKLTPMSFSFTACVHPYKKLTPKFPPTLSKKLSANSPAAKHPAYLKITAASTNSSLMA